jgi:hypothetical protein
VPPKAQATSRYSPQAAAPHRVSAKIVVLRRVKQYAPAPRPARRFFSARFYSVGSPDSNAAGHEEPAALPSSPSRAFRSPHGIGRDVEPVGEDGLLIFTRWSDQQSLAHRLSTGKKIALDGFQTKFVCDFRVTLTRNLRSLQWDRLTMIGRRPTMHPLQLKSLWIYPQNATPVDLSTNRRAATPLPGDFFQRSGGGRAIAGRVGLLVE